VFDNTIFTQQQMGNMVALSFSMGTRYSGAALFELIATPAPPAMVTGNGSALTQRASKQDLELNGEGWFWEPATGGTLWIYVTGGATITVQ
jgi:hypothetical protein